MKRSITTLAEAEGELAPYRPMVTQLLGRDLSLDRIAELMRIVGNPHKRLKAIHIAGTSGKTSTAYYISRLLANGGHKVGLTVSPHVDLITERIQINNQPLSERAFCEALTTFLEIIEKAEFKPSYFELLYGFALWVFDREGVDYAVVETGMGGLHDATNILGREDKLCIITDIGYDHMQILGNTLSEIAAQKVGIVHEQNEIFMYTQAGEIMDVVQDWVQSHQAHLHQLSAEPPTESLPIATQKLPAYQIRNWYLAYEAVQFIIARDKLSPLSVPALASSIMNAVPGRLEVKQYRGKQIVMDGAHNEQKITAFIQSYQRLFPGVKPTVVIAFRAGKQYESCLELLAVFAKKAITTQFTSEQDLIIAPVDAQELAKGLERAGLKDVQCFTDPAVALNQALDGHNPHIVITGSFYLLSELRKLMK